MGLEGLLVVAIIFVTLILLVLEKASLDAIGIGLLVGLVGLGQLLEWAMPGFDASAQLIDTKDALALFGNYAVITIAALYVIGEGLNRTGAVEFLARVVLASSGGRERRMVLVVGLMAGFLSAFLNNTGVVVVFIPVLIGLSKTSGIPASRLMIPLSFASILGGMTTLVGTSPNLLVSGVAENLGYEPLGMFEMTPIGLPLMIAGVVFMAFFAKKLLPNRPSLTTMMDDTGIREYVTELSISGDSPLVGQTYGAAFTDNDVKVLFYGRNEDMMWPPFNDTIVQEGDVAMIRGSVDNLLEMQDKLGLRNHDQSHFDPRTMQYFELAVSPKSSLVGRYVGDLHLFRDYHTIAMAVLRHGHHIRERASRMVLRAGDLLLVSGDAESRAKLRASSDFYLLESPQDRVVLRNLGRRALAIALGVVVLFSAASVFHASDLLPYIAMGGALAMVASGCLKSRRAYRSIDWPILVFVIGTLALGKAMDQSGAAAFFASGIVDALSGWGAGAVISGLVFLCIVVNALISPSAVAVLLTPIAISSATAMAAAGYQGDPDVLMRAFILAIVFGGSICFATPIGHQTNLMVYGPGGYKFGDFLKLGLPLSLIAWVVVSLALPWMAGL